MNRDPMLPVMAEVQAVARETSDTFTLQLRPKAGNMPGFHPGQFDMLWVFGAGELPISVSGDPEERGSLTYTVRSVGKATNKLVTSAVGARVGVRGHYGNGWPLQAVQGMDVIVVAGGLGLAPLRPALYHMFRHRADYGRIVLAYGARSPRDIIYRREIARWKRYPGTQLLTTVDYGGVNWHGHVGVVTRLLDRIRVNPAHTAALVCGPEVMMRFAALDFEARGVPRESIYVSLERNMKCAIGTCGHCQFGPWFVCRDGPVFRFAQVREWLARYEI